LSLCDPEDPERQGPPLTKNKRKSVFAVTAGAFVPLNCSQ